MRAVTTILLLASMSGRESGESAPGRAPAQRGPTVQEAAPGTGQQEEAPLPLPRLTGPIDLDGRPDEAAWTRVDPLPMVTVQPVAGNEPGAPTDLRVAYDDTHLYLGGRLGTTHPDEPTIRTFVRDRWADGDAIELVLDTYGDNESAVIFTVNAAGNRIDAEVGNDAEFTYGFPINDSWNTYWDAATAREDGAWTLEMRIPLSSLRFQSEDGRVVMGMIVHRYIARLNESSTFPAIEPNWNLGVNKPSQARDIVLEGVRPARPLYASPYVLLGVQRRWGMGEGDGSFPGSDTWAREIGGDLRFGPTDHLNLDVTVNTDFAQVEADDRQVNLTRFDLFFPEKRQFFQERASLFEFRTGQGNRLFHSRRIGIVDGGRIGILGGARLVGRVGSWDIGALGMQTERGGAVTGDAVPSDAVPSENFGVLRARRPVLNALSTIGGMVTTRIGGGTAHTAYGVDGSLWLGGGRYLSVRWAQTFADGSGGLGTGAAQLAVEDRRRRGLGYRLELGRTGPEYDPPVGFVQRRDVREAAGQVTWGIFGGPESPVRRWGPRVEASALIGDSDGELETAELSTGWELELGSGALFNGSVVTTREWLADEFVLRPGAATVPAGRHDFMWGRWFARTPPSAALSASLFGRVGGFFDGWIVSATLSPRWRPSPHLELSADLESSRARFDARNETFDARILRLRTTVSANIRLSAEAFVQFSSVEDVVLANLRIRYNMSEGRDLWLVLDETRSTGREALRPTVPPLRDRTLLLKYTHPIRVF